MAKTEFFQGTIITPGFLNAINSLTFDGADEDGHLPPIGDNSLSQEPNSISSRVNAFLDIFKPTIGLGLNLLIGEGSYLSPNGNVYSSIATQITLPNNQTGFVFFDGAGTLLYSQTLPQSPYLAIAKVVTENALITQVIDLRDRAIGQAQGLLWPDYSNTTIQRANFTAQSKQRVLLDSELGSFTVTLPLTPADGAKIQFLDTSNSLSTNPVTVDRNGKLINGLAQNLVLGQSGSAIELVYVSATGDWRILGQNAVGTTSQNQLKNTTIVTGDYDAKAFDLVLCDSTAQSFTVTLPQTPVDGALIGICDVGNNFNLFPVSLEGNLATVMGLSDPWEMDSQSVYVELVFVEALSDWRFKEVKGVRSNSGSSVELTGTQTIQGHKIFQGEISVPEPQSPNSAISKSYLDQAIALGVVSRDLALTNTTVKSSSYLAKAFERVLIDTSGQAFQVTLPPNPINGSIVVIVDIGGQLARNSVTVVRNGKLIDSLAQNLLLSQSKAYVELVYLAELNSWIQRRDSDGQTSNDRARWTIISSSYNASIGDRLAIDTSSSPLILTLPRNPVLGDSLELMRLSDLNANALTLTKASNVQIEGSVQDFVLSTNAFSRFILVWNNQWRLIQA